MRRGVFLFKMIIMVQDLKTIISFFNLKDKYRDDYYVTMKHLEEKYSISKIDYKMFHPNLIRNNDHIEFHQNIHRDFTFDPPIVVK